MKYIERVLAELNKKYADQPEFLQAAREVLDSIAPAVEKNEAVYERLASLERIVEPDRQIQFKIPWVHPQEVS